MPITHLTQTHPAFPNKLMELHDPPTNLYLRGTLPLKRAVAVVGTRKMTPYGAYAASMAAQALVDLNVTVVSGLAIGIDAKAHMTALKAGGATVAVLGGGIDDATIYPRLNFGLAQDILKSGYALLSEYAPKTSCRKHHFHARNRLVAGLSEAVLLIEAPKRSGAMMTARLALENGRSVWAVPGPITQENAIGPNSLIRDGATPITCPEDIADALGLTLPAKELNLNPAETTIAEALRAGHDTLDALGIILKRSPAEISTSLTQMELKNLIVPFGGGRYKMYTP